MGHVKIRKLRLNSTFLEIFSCKTDSAVLSENSAVIFVSCAIRDSRCDRTVWTSPELKHSSEVSGVTCDGV